MTGDKEENSGTVYVRWGHNQHPLTVHVQLVYTGRAGGPHHTHSGGGSNPQCLPMDLKFLSAISVQQLVEAKIEHCCMELNIKSTLRVTVMSIHGRHNTDNYVRSFVLH